MQIQPLKTEKKPVFRHELKFLISELDKACIVQQLKLIASPDTHASEGQYFIRSLYFDDLWESSWRDKLAGVSDREKYRIRFYDQDDSIIHLECKRKVDQYINKISAGLTRYETERILNGDYQFLEKRPEKVCTDFYLACMERRMRPSVIVDYDREPWTYTYGDVRITFDMHVRAGMMGKDLFDASMPVMEMMERGKLIMEVKYTGFLPSIIQDMLQPSASEYTAFSKYVFCLEKMKEFTTG